MLSVTLLPHVVTWHDNEPTGAMGWLVIDSLHQGVASGGLFMHSEANLEEVAALAKTMSWKNALQEPRIGGAKGGIRFDHTHPEAHNVLRRFLLAHHAYIRDLWSTGADLNTDNYAIHRIIRDELKLPSGFVSVSTMLSRFYGIENRADAFLGVISQSVSDYFTLGQCATGYSTAVCIEALCYSRARILIQGWGNVGRSLGYYLQTRQLGDVVGIIEKDYFIYHDNKLDVKQLLSIRQDLIQDNLFCTEGFLAKVEAAGYFVIRRTVMQSDEAFLAHCLSTVSADIFCPCAQRYAITNRICDILMTHTFKDKAPGNAWIISGANNVFATPLLIPLLEKSGIAIVPEWVANSGNTLLYNELLKNQQASECLPEAWLSAINHRVKQFLTNALLITEKQNISLYQACYTLIEGEIAQSASVAATQ